VDMRIYSQFHCLPSHCLARQIVWEEGGGGRVGWKVWKARLSIQNFSNLRAGQTVTFKSPPGLTGCGELSGRRCIRGVIPGIYPRESIHGIYSSQSLY
jgi:hypothetical protein